MSRPRIMGVDVHCPECNLVGSGAMTITCRWCRRPVALQSTAVRAIVALVQQMEQAEGDSQATPGDADRLPIPLCRQRLAEVELLLRRIVEFYRAPDGSDELVLVRRSELDQQC